MAGRALRRRDRRLAGLLLSERDLDHARLARVAERRRGPVGVDVADVVRADAGVVHAPSCIARARVLRRSDRAR